MLCARVYFVICKTFVIFNGELIVLHGEDELPALVTTVVMSSPIYIPGSYNLATAFKFYFNNEITEEKGCLKRYLDERNQLEKKVEAVRLHSMRLIICVHSMKKQFKFFVV
jgi:hypothetical protein